MSTGVQYRDPYGRGTLVRLFENLAAANVVLDGAPGDVLQRIPIPTKFFDYLALGETFPWPDSSTLRIYETAGSGTMTVASARVWLYDALSSKRFPAGDGSDSLKGMLNAGSALGETAADQVRHSGTLLYFKHFQGIQVELGALGGTTPAYNCDWFLPPIVREDWTVPPAMRS